MSPERRYQRIAQFAAQNNGVLVTSCPTGFVCQCCGGSAPFASQIHHAATCVLHEPDMTGVGCIGLKNDCRCSWCSDVRDTQAVALGLV